MFKSDDAFRFIKSRMRPVEPDSHEKRLKDAIADARVLLKFSIESHKNILPKVIDDLVSSIDQLWPAGQHVPNESGDSERAFWNAYETLSELAAPVTARSVLQSRWQSKGWLSVTLPYAFVALVLFMFIVLLQWRWFDGTTLRSSLKEHEERIKKLDSDYLVKWRVLDAASQLIERGNRDLRQQGCPQYFDFLPDNKRKPVPAIKKDACAKLQKARDDAQSAVGAPQMEARASWDDLARTRSSLESKFDLLEEWMNRWPFAYPSGDDEKKVLRDAQSELKHLRETLARDQQERDRLRYMQFPPIPPNSATPPRANPANPDYAEDRRKLDAVEAKIRDQERTIGEKQRIADQDADNRIERLKHRVTQRLDMLERYVFPTLLGALGSLIYILRSLISAIRDHVYTSHFLSLSIVRISLGTIAGLLGTLIFPRESLPVKDLLPLAVPLLLGYAVEIFFTAMDRLVKAFSDAPK